MLGACRQPDAAKEQEIAAFLCRYPDFFERHPEILTQLFIPHPDSGQAVSLLERQLGLMREQLSTERRHHEQLMVRAEQNERLQEQLRNLFLMLSQAVCTNDLLIKAPKVLVEEFSLVSASLRVLNTKVRNLDLTEVIPPNDTITAILEKLGTRGGFCDNQLSDDAKDFLFGKQASEVGSVAIVGILKQSGVLVLGAGEKDRYCPGMDTTFLEFVGSLISATWSRVTISSSDTK